MKSSEIGSFQRAKAYVTELNVKLYELNEFFAFFHFEWKERKYWVKAHAKYNTTNPIPFTRISLEIGDLFLCKSCRPYLHKKKNSNRDEISEDTKKLNPVANSQTEREVWVFLLHIETVHHTWSDCFANKTQHDFDFAFQISHQPFISLFRSVRFFSHFWFNCVAHAVMTFHFLSGYIFIYYLPIKWRIKYAHRAREKRIRQYIRAAFRDVTKFYIHL